MMRIVAFLIVMVLATTANAGNIVLTPPQYKKITRALVKCKAIKKQCVVDVKAEKKRCDVLRERDKALCQAVKPVNPWPFVVVGVLGVAVGVGVGVVVGLSAK